MGYREFATPAALNGLIECVWVTQGPPGPVRVLPDGCMDLIRMDGRIVVAGPDTAASTAMRGPEAFVGLRFRPGVLPRLLGTPASALRDERVPLADVRPVPGHVRSLIELTARMAAEEPRPRTAPWPMPLLDLVTARLAAGATVDRVAAEVGWSRRTLHRQCLAVYGYGPATLRRILRFRRAARLLKAGVPVADVAARTGYADQPHLHREVRALAGVPSTELRQEASGAKRSTQLPSGSATVA
ncbi:AraC family transcriptional regulator [Mycobacterium sp. B14F4]|uniref:AraC family transcriptional regulator n=1 Tax=Mycobacterium sp. B14F4 TaxID=3153565 RepID=UPI00325C547B